MKTTAVFAEILTIGLQTMCWIGLALYAFGAFDAVSINWDNLGKWSVLLTAIILALAYTAGVLIDRVADYMVRTKSKRTKHFGTVRLTVYLSGGGMVDFLEYQRSRLRVARSTVINVAMAGVFGAYAARESWWWVAVLAAAGAGCFLAWRAFIAIDSTYHERLAQAYELVKND